MCARARVLLLVESLCICRQICPMIFAACFWWPRASGVHVEAICAWSAWWPVGMCPKCFFFFFVSVCICCSASASQRTYPFLPTVLFLFLVCRFSFLSFFLSLSLSLQVAGGGRHVDATRLKAQHASCQLHRLPAIDGISRKGAVVVVPTPTLAPVIWAMCAGDEMGIFCVCVCVCVCV